MTGFRRLPSSCQLRVNGFCSLLWFASPANLEPSLGDAGARTRAVLDRKHVALVSSVPFGSYRFISGKEIKKRKGLFGLHLRVPPPAPQVPDCHGDGGALLISDNR